MDPENPILAALLSMGRGVKEDFQEFQRRPVGFMIDAGRNFLRDPLMTHASADAFDSGHPVIGSLLAGAGAAAVIPGEAVAARAGLTRVPKPRSFPRSAGEIEAALEDEYVDALMSQAQQQVRTTTIDPNSHMIGQVAELLNNYDIPGLTEITRTRYPELRDMVIDVSSQNLEDLDDMLIDSYMDLSRQHGLSAQVRGEEETTLKLLTNLIQSERAQRAILNGDDEISRAFFEETVEPDYGLLDVLKYEGHIGGDEIINPETFFDPQFAAETLNQSRANVELYKFLLGIEQ